MTDTPEGVAGWYGKIASLGDFASRRLAPDFITRWDGWLQEVMSASRGHLGESWLDAYLTSPVWRFILFPGVCGEATWVGVFMPSVDKVGRYFPVTITCETPVFATTEREFNALADWLDRIESLALSTLCLLYTSDAADERSSVDLGGRRIIKKKKKAIHDVADSPETADQTITDSK